MNVDQILAKQQEVREEALAQRSQELALRLGKSADTPWDILLEEVSKLTWDGR